MNAPQNLAFQNLLAAWSRREDARTEGDIATLASARATLEHARAQMRAAAR